MEKVLVHSNYHNGQSSDQYELFQTTEEAIKFIANVVIHDCLAFGEWDLTRRSSEKRYSEIASEIMSHVRKMKSIRVNQVDDSGKILKNGDFTVYNLIEKGVKQLSKDSTFKQGSLVIINWSRPEKIIYKVFSTLEEGREYMKAHVIDFKDEEWWEETYRDENGTPYRLVDNLYREKSVVDDWSECNRIFQLYMDD